MDLKILTVIPSRYHSSRFPGKPLIDLNGMTMIERVHAQVLKCKSISDIVIATESELVYNHTSAFCQTMITDANHENGTQRCGEVLQRLHTKYDVIINVQGDEPFIDPKALTMLCEAFKTPCQIASLYNNFEDVAEIENPNLIKVITDANNDAMYFSRSPIPYKRYPLSIPTKKHIGVYAFDATIFQELLQLPSTAIEQAESLEQLKWMHYGYKLKMIETEYQSIGIDVPDDLIKLKLKGLI
jgi:3-deoxy-manno-octulosonate cytidylyltransferase (CMP-KDO synthetase)